MKIPSSTAFNWQKSDEVSDKFVESRNPESGRPVGRSPKLTDAHREYPVNLIDENDTGLLLNQTMESLTTEFMGLQNPKSAIHEFARTKCRISCKRARFFSLRKGLVLRQSSKGTIGSSTGRILTWVLKVSAYSLMKQAFI